MLRETRRAGVPLLAVLLLLTGCVSGGKLVSKDFTPQQTLVSYRAEGIFPEGTEYALVQTEQGLAMHERVFGQTGALAEEHWVEADGDHFVAWIKAMSTLGPAYEFIVPADRAQVARRYVYPAGTYTVRTVGESKRPLPSHPQKTPATWLIPKDTPPGGSPMEKELSQRFRDEVGGFSYVPPMGMVLMNVPGFRFKTPTSPPVNGITSIVAFRKEPLPASADATAAEKALINILNLECKGQRQVAKEEFATASGLAGTRYVFEKDVAQGQQQRTILFASAPAKESRYIVICITRTGPGQVADEVFDAFLKSFAVE